MSQIQISLPDGSRKNLPKGSSALDVAKDIGEGLARAALAAKVDGKVVDLTMPIEKDAKVQILTFKDEEGVEVFRHTSTHIMAAAVRRLYKGAKFGVGPVVEEGYYYDMGIPAVKEEDVPKIEAEMKKIVKENVPCIRKEISKKEALALFKDQPFKCELIAELPEDEVISIYEMGDFTDLCRGPHLPNTGKVKALKVTKIAGAYWKGDKENPQLQRLYGISFPSKDALKEHLRILEEAQKRDHRKIGKNMELLMFHDWSPGSPFLLPKGAVIYRELLKLFREEYFKRDYQEVLTPQIFNNELWKTSGHWEHYKEHMFHVKMDGEDASIKPMNCPSHLLIYKQSIKSYRDLPLRIADFCPLHRNELKGVLGGMTRVRRFCQDDGHLFCKPEDIKSEIQSLLDFIRYIYVDVFNLKYKAKLSTKPEKAMGDDKLWEEAEAALQKALEDAKLEYEIKEGDGAFYGPKIDFDIKDALGREWQCATVQLDFQMPLRFDATYEGEDGKKHHCIIVHRAIAGSLERFLAVLIEHYAGKFPLWLSPNQVKIIAVADRFLDYANTIKQQLKAQEIRVEIDKRHETVNKKVRDAQLQQYNYIIVVGEQEQKNNSVTVRTRDGVVHGEKAVDKFIKELKEEIKSRKE